MEDCGNSSAFLTMELLQSCTKPLIYVSIFSVLFIPMYASDDYES